MLIESREANRIGEHLLHHNAGQSQKVEMDVKIMQLNSVSATELNACRNKVKLVALK